MIRNHTTNGPLINLSGFFDLGESDSPEHARTDQQPQDLGESSTEDWGVGPDFDPDAPQPEIKNKMNKAKHLAEESQAARAIHARCEKDTQGSELDDCDPASTEMLDEIAQCAPQKRKREPESVEREKGMDALALLLEAAGKAEKANKSLTSSMVELSKKTESAEAIVQRIDAVANDAISRIEASVQESFRAIPNGAGGRTSLDSKELEKLERNLSDMLASEYRHHAESLERLASSFTPEGQMAKDSALWESLTAYIGEKMDYFERSIDERISRQLAQGASAGRLGGAGGSSSSIEKRIMAMERQYRRSRKSTLVVGVSLFVSLAAIAVSVGSGLSFQQIFSVFFGA